LSRGSFTENCRRSGNAARQRNVVLRGRKGEWWGREKLCGEGGAVKNYGRRAAKCLRRIFGSMKKGKTKGEKDVRGG